MNPVRLERRRCTAAAVLKTILQHDDGLLGRQILFEYDLPRSGRSKYSL